MKHTILTGVFIIASMTSVAQTFTIKANIPGIHKGCKVELCMENDETLAEGITDEGGFTLKGQAKHIMLAELRINDKPSYAEGEYPMERGIKLMLEGDTDIQIEAACIDSVPLIYEPDNAPVFLEPYVHVKGGKVQEHYLEWRRWIYNAECARMQTEYLETAYKPGRKRQRSDNYNLQEAIEDAINAIQEVENRMTTMFIAKHPDYAISLMMQRERLNNVFSYNDTELDSLLACFSNNEDKEGYVRFAGQVEKMRQYTRGTHYTDFSVYMADGTEKKFSELVKPGQWNYIDFWASWCGPCRAAIPAVKKLYAKHSDKINIVSISVDKLNESWRQAMEQEQMPWAQAIATTEGAGVLSEKYKLTSIPLIIIIDPEGNIQLATHTPAEADRFIIEKLKN